MSQIILFEATTDAVATEQQFDASSYEWIQVSADNLAGAEEVQIFKEVGETWVAVSDLDGNQVTLSATVTAVGLMGGCVYGFTKDATAGACSVYVVPGRGIGT